MIKSSKFLVPNTLAEDALQATNDRKTSLAKTKAAQHQRVVDILELGGTPEAKALRKCLKTQFGSPSPVRVMFGRGRIAVRLAGNIVMTRIGLRAVKSYDRCIDGGEYLQNDIRKIGPQHLDSTTAKSVADGITAQLRQFAASGQTSEFIDGAKILSKG